MKKFVIYMLSSLLLTQSAFALLPPLYDSADQIKAILSSEDLDKYLESGELILNIRRTQSGYEITTNRQRVQAEVTPAPVSRPGPGKYSIRFKKASPIGSAPGSRME